MSAACAPGAELSECLFLAAYQAVHKKRLKDLSKVRESRKVYENKAIDVDGDVIWGKKEFKHAGGSGDLACQRIVERRHVPKSGRSAAWRTPKGDLKSL